MTKVFRLCWTHHAAATGRRQQSTRSCDLYPNT